MGDGGGGGLRYTLVPLMPVQMPEETSMSDPQLTKIPGIGPSTARLLTENGFASVEAIANAGYRDLAKVQGFGEVRAAVVITAAQALVSADATPPAAAASRKIKKDRKGKKGKKGKKKKKLKKDKKGKGKGKGKGKKKDGKKKRKK
jgi:transcription termination factor NusA